MRKFLISKDRWVDRGETIGVSKENSGSNTYPDLIDTPELKARKDMNFDRNWYISWWKSSFEKKSDCTISWWWVLWTKMIINLDLNLQTFLPSKRIATYLLERDHFNPGSFIFQPLFFRGHVSFQGGILKFRNFHQPSPLPPKKGTPNSRAPCLLSLVSDFPVKPSHPSPKKMVATSGL